MGVAGVRWRPAVVIALVVVLLGALPATATSPRFLEARLLELVNVERHDAGVPPLNLASDLVRIARNWSGSMAAAGVIQHNPNLAEQMCCRLGFAENVAWGGAPEGYEVESIEGVHRALMASPSHRDNLLNPVFDQVGIGVVLVDGILYVTQDFRRQHVVPLEPEDVAMPESTASATAGGTASRSVLPPSRAKAMLIRIERSEMQVTDGT